MISLGIRFDRSPAPDCSHVACPASQAATRPHSRMLGRPAHALRTFRPWAEQRPRATACASVALGLPRAARTEHTLRLHALAVDIKSMR